MKNWLCYLLTSLLFTSCAVHDEELKKGFWKFGGGYYIGDFLDFNTYDLRNDTIYFRGKPEAILKSTTKGFMGYEDYMIIQDLNSDETGRYHHK